MDENEIIKRFNRIYELMLKMHKSKVFLGEFAEKCGCLESADVYKEDAYMLQLFINLLQSDKFLESIENVYKDL